MAKQDRTAARAGWRGWLRGEGRSLIVTLALLMFARTSFANHYVVPSGSMQHTLEPGDHVLVDMTAYGVRVPFTDIVAVDRDIPRRGDVAVFPSPVDGTRLIKRVAAVGGDRVALADGHLSINGKALDAGDASDIERFGTRRVALDLAAGGGPDIAALTVPQGQVLMLGDHRGDSADGRFFGLVPQKLLYGRATRVFYRRGEGVVWKTL